MVKGCVLLTNHRIFFIAYLPNQGSLSANGGNQNSAPIRSGPGIIHRRSLHVRRKVWFELRHDSLRGYPKSDRMYEPLGGVTIAHIADLKSYEQSSKEIHFTIHGDPCTLEFDTKEM